MVGIVRRAAAAFVLLAVVFGFPLLMLATVGNPWPPGGVDEILLVSDRAILGAVAAFGWLIWAQLVACAVAEIPPAMHGEALGARRLPIALPVQQQLMRTLVRIVFAAGVTSAALTPTFTESTAASDVPLLTEPAPSVSTGRAAADDVRTVTTATGDTLWGLAETHLGDGMRWREIADLNRGRTMSDGRVLTDPASIEPGWELLLPADAVNVHPSRNRTEVVVDAGDNLSAIAEQELGDANDWPKLYDANRTVIGDDPDLIQPGQVLHLSKAADKTLAVTPPAEPSSPVTPPAPSTSMPVAPSTDRPQQSRDQSVEQVELSSNDPSSTEFSVLRALLASGIFLAGGAMALLVANRRRQLHERRAGRAIASMPKELTEVEQAVIEHGTDAQRDVEFLDRALRSLAASSRVAGTPLPAVGAAVMSQDGLALLLLEPSSGPTPEGWATDSPGTTWTLPRDATLETDLCEQAPPYPALVTVGIDDIGRTWLVDLEATGMSGIYGPKEQVADLTRFLVAELVVNAWSEHADVLLVDQFAAELVDLNPYRLRPLDHETAVRRAARLGMEQAASESATDVTLLDLRRDNRNGDSTGPLILVMGPDNTGEIDEVDEQVDRVARSQVVVLYRNPTGREKTPPVVEVTGDGLARLPRWNVTVRPHLLPSVEAEAMAAMIASTRDLTDQPVPPAPESSRLSGYGRADGMLTDEFTEPRRPDEHDGASVLADPDKEYVSVAATTGDQLEALAPSLAADARAELDAHDPELVTDVEDWLNPSSKRPKVHVLGPIDVTSTTGVEPQAIRNVLATIEFLVYLAHQDQPVPAERIADLFGWTSQTVQNRARDARKLLGPADQDDKWLPRTRTNVSGGSTRAIQGYRLDRGEGGVLVDADLFTRLRLRAQKRGEDGFEDLLTALSLVRGEPYTGIRPSRSRWLIEGERHDQILTCAIDDLAHTVAIRANRDGDTDLVHRAAETAHRANPNSHIAWLDLATVTEIEHGRRAAEDLIRTHVVGDDEDDLPGHIERILDQRNWLTG